jgi:hypothetical protein
MAHPKPTKWVPATYSSRGAAYVASPGSNERMSQPQRPSNGPSFWVTNLTPMNVSLADLNLTVKAFSSVNLLDKKHYSYTLEQLQKSAESGSLFNKRDRIAVRKIAPEILTANVPLLRETFIPTRERSVLAIKEENYEELNVTDEEFANENAETAAMDTLPLVTKKP